MIHEDRFDHIPQDGRRARAWVAALQPLAATVCALYNNATDTFADPMVRKAFDMVLDRAAIAETVGATAVAAPGLVPYGITDYVSESGEFRICGGDLYHRRLHRLHLPDGRCKKCRLRV